jgi:glucokinase
MNIIAVDLGGTNTRAAKLTSLEQVSFSGEPIRRRNTHNYDKDLQFIIDTAHRLSDGQPIDGVGIGVPGRVNNDKTDMIGSNNLPEWTNRNFVADLSSALNAPIYLDNDGIAAGLGEGYFGNRGDDFHYLIWGTGISSVKVEHRDGQLTASYARRDHHDYFEEWEHKCGGAALMRNYGKPVEKLSEEDWSAVMKIFAHYLREYIALAVPPAIIFGGGLAVRHSNAILEGVRGLELPISMTAFSGDSGLVGGLALVKRGIVAASIN